jgi:3alpha(or 20beta)-hydroxysteroid dehydrogenase
MHGKVALISGAARGQGAAEARLFVAEGAHVILGDVLDEQGQAVADKLDGKAMFHHLDVREPDGWEAILDAGIERFGPITNLVNNAGVLKMGSVMKTSLEDYRRVIEINQIGCFLGMQAAARRMKDSGGGAIVNISSTAGMVGLGNMTAYTASKWAIRGMTKSAAIELAKHGIRVNAVMPGSVKTPMIGVAYADGPDPVTSATVPIGRSAEPEEIANVVLFLSSDEASYCTGQEFVVDGATLAGFAMPG